MELKFYKCSHCGNIITKIYDAKVPVMCCGQKMDEIIPGSVDAATEKHVPVYTVENNVCKVTVGSVAHPMTEPHYIQWIVAQTNAGFQIKYLAPTDQPEASFALADGEKVEAVFAYCNLHGLWRA